MTASSAELKTEPRFDTLGFRHEPRTLTTPFESQTLQLYVKGEEGPPLILLHELPGLSRKTFELGDEFVRQNFRVILPLLFGEVGQDNAFKATVQICVQQQLREICLGKDGDLTRLIAAPVLAQPSAGYSARALEAVRTGWIQSPVLALRFEKDLICSSRKLARLEDAFATCPAQSNPLLVHELEGCGHSTLVYQYSPNDRRRDLRSADPRPIDAREAVTAFLNAQLRGTLPTDLLPS